MKKVMIAVAAAVVLAVVGFGTWAWASGDSETSQRGSCGSSTYEMSVEAEDKGLEVTFELLSAGVGEIWQVSFEQDGASIFDGERQTDEDGELDVDVFTPNKGDEFTVTATPADGEACTATLTR